MCGVMRCDGWLCATHVAVRNSDDAQSRLESQRGAGPWLSWDLMVEASRPLKKSVPMQSTAECLIFKAPVPEAPGELHDDDGRAFMFWGPTPTSTLQLSWAGIPQRFRGPCQCSQAAGPTTARLAPEPPPPACRLGRPRLSSSHLRAPRTAGSS